MPEWASRRSECRRVHEQDERGRSSPEQEGERHREASRRDERDAVFWFDFSMSAGFEAGEDAVH